MNSVENKLINTIDTTAASIIDLSVFLAFFLELILGLLLECVAEKSKFMFVFDF
jgi:hypothetical protein